MSAKRYSAKPPYPKIQPNSLLLPKYHTMMKFFRPVLFLVMLLLGAAQLKADVATEGEVDVYIELLNGNEFPGYKFFIKYQNYEYNMGYQPAGVQIVFLEPGKHVSTGDRGSSSLLFAEGKRGKYQSSIEVGGSEINHTEGLQYVLDRIKITKVDKKGLRFEVVERQLIGENGTVLETIQKGSLEPLNLQAFLLWLLPIVCLVGLVLFFLFRKKAVTA